MLKISVPASTSNFGSGFDAFGLALELYNYFYVDFSEEYRVYVEGEGQSLPKDESNLFVRVYKKSCELFGFPQRPISVRQINHVPTARGLGSSSTAIVGGILAFERLHGVSLSMDERLKVAFEFEPHPDNLLPALLGGFVVCANSEEGVKFLKLEFPSELRVVVCIPDFELSTEKAREVLKKEVTLKDAVYNLQRSALFVSAIVSKKFDLLREAVKDKLHQPYRSGLIPGFWKVVEEAYACGALAVFLSGAGPTVASLCSQNFETVGGAMERAFAEAGVSSRFLILSASKMGASVEE